MQLLKNLLTKTLQGYIFFISEIVTFILVYTFTLFSIWYYFSQDLWFVKILISLVILSNCYNMVKHFIMVRLTIWKAQQKNLKNEDWFKELK